MKISKVLAVSAVVTCLVTTSVFAANVSGQSTPTPTQKSAITTNKPDAYRGIRGGMNKGGFKGQGNFGMKMGNPLAGLVTAGTITQAQADAIGSAMKGAKDSNKTMKKVLDGLVTVGTITQAQEDAALKVLPPNGAKGHHKNPMNDLITAGTITQAQADAIHTAIDVAKGTDKTTNDILVGLVKAGTITQAQADAVLKVLPPNCGKGRHIGQHKNVMNDLVTAGTITQAQADAIRSAMKSAKDSGKTVREVLDGLIAAGTITQAQEDAIFKVIPTRK